MDLVEAMTTTGTCRSFRPDPIPDDVLMRAFDAARFAPQGGNVEPVRWIVVRDRGRRRALAELYEPLWHEYLDALRARFELDSLPRSLANADHFARHFAEVPAILVSCVRMDRLLATDDGLGRLSIVGGASVYPFVQNLCLALRAEGVATAITTFLCRVESEVRELLAIPGEFGTACHVAAGYPARAWPRKLRRLPVSELVFAERFGASVKASAAS
ncbi:MAG TPA: nitroreductase family protein [Thermoleophilaceae bacterium]